MINNLELFIALKQLKAKWKQTSLATLSVSVGVMILICALSLTNGFEKDLVDKILGNNPHITVESAISDRISSYKEFLKKISKIDGVTSATPVIRGQALLNNGLEVKGILIYGIDPDLENKASKFYKSLKKGALVNDETSIVLGAELAKKIGASVGDMVQIVTGVGIMTPMIITGIYEADFYEIDVRIGFINLDKARKIYNLSNDSINTISVKVNSPFKADEISEKILNDLPMLNVRSWLRDNKALLAAMATEKKVIFLVMMFIIIVAMLGTANLLVMIVLEKTTEISILRAIGANKKNISLIFLYQGMFIGITGILLGCLGGYSASILLKKYPVRIPGDVYIIDSLPVDIQINDFIFVSLSAFIVCLIASIVPARRATRLKPIEAIRRNR